MAELVILSSSPCSSLYHLIQRILIFLLKRAQGNIVECNGSELRIQAFDSACLVARLLRFFYSTTSAGDPRPKKKIHPRTGLYSYTPIGGIRWAPSRAVSMGTVYVCCMPINTCSHLKFVRCFAASLMPRPRSLTHVRHVSRRGCT